MHVRPNPKKCLFSLWNWSNHFLCQRSCLCLCLGPFNQGVNINTHFFFFLHPKWTFKWIKMSLRWLNFSELFSFVGEVIITNTLLFTLMKSLYTPFRWLKCGNTPLWPESKWMDFNSWVRPGGPHLACCLWWSQRFALLVDKLSEKSERWFIVFSLLVILSLGSQKKSQARHPLLRDKQ